MKKPKDRLPQIDVRQLELKAIEKYKKCPKHLTVVRHADHQDDSQFHCVLVSFTGPVLPGTDPRRREFIIPGQEVLMVEDVVYGGFTIIRVADKLDGKEYALVISIQTRLGFILLPEDLPTDLLVTTEG